MKKSLVIALAGLLAVSPLAACRKGNGVTDESQLVEQSAANEEDPFKDREVDEHGYYIAYRAKEESDDLLSIEQVNVLSYIVDLESNTRFYKWRALIRNSSGHDLRKAVSAMRVWYRYLDKDRQPIATKPMYISAGYNSTIESGRTEWIEQNGYPGSWGKEELKAVAYIELYGYATALSAKPEAEFNKHVIIDVHKLLAVEE